MPRISKFFANSKVSDWTGRAMGGGGAAGGGAGTALALLGKRDGWVSGGRKGQSTLLQDRMSDCWTRTCLSAGGLDARLSVAEGA